jgi:hypothetical protein
MTLGLTDFLMTPEAALDHLERHGVLLASARGPLPNLAEAVAGAPVRGSWWAHPRGRQIFAVLRFLEESPEVLVCRAVDGKISFVHRRLWPALVRLAPRFPVGHLARLRQEHTAAGHHQNREEPFPQWVPAQVMRLAAELSEEQAVAALGAWVLSAAKPKQE